MKFLCATFALAAMVFGSAAHAECQNIRPEDMNEWALDFTSDGVVSYFSERRAFYPGAIIDVEADLPVGAVITTGTTLPEGLTYMFLCLNGGTMRFDLLNTPKEISPGIYDTGVPGVGYRVKYRRASGSISALPFLSAWPSGPDAFVAMSAGNVFDIELVKTGPMQSESVITLGRVAYAAGFAESVPAVEVIAQPVTLRVLPHCHVTSDKSLLVDFGPFGPRDVSTADGPTKPVVIDVACDGPTPPDTVSATLMAQPAPQATDFIKNDGTATGLAIRLQETGTNNILKPQDPNSVSSKKTPGFNSSFDFEATVLRVGGAVPTAGSIDAQAVVTLTFL